MVDSKSVLLRLENFISFLKDAETAQRGYLLTKNSKFLEPYRSSYDSVIVSLHKLYQLTGNDENYKNSLDTLNHLVESRYTQFEKHIGKVRRNESFDVELALKGRVTMDSIRTIVKILKKKENLYLNSKIEEDTNSARFTSIIIVTFSLAALTLAVLAFFRVDRHYNALRKVEASLKKEKDKLLNSQNTLQGIMDISQNGIFVFKSVRNSQNKIVDFKLLLLNPKAESLTDLTQNQVGKNMSELIPECFITDLFKKYVEVIEKQIPLNIEFESPYYQRWFLISAAKLDDGITITYSDIHERKLAEKELLENKIKFEAIFNQTVQFMALLGLDGRIKDVNQTATQFSGIPFEGYLGKTLGESPSWNLPGEKEQLERSMKIAASGKVIRLESKIKGSNGQIVHMDLSLKPIVDVRGQYIFIIAEGRDITELVKSTEEIRTKNRIIEGLFKSFPLLLCKINRQGVFTEVSGSGLNSLKVKEDDLVGKKVIENFPSIDEELQKALSGESVTFEGRVKVGEKTLHFFNYYFFEKSTECVVGITLDVTIQKEAEIEIHQKNQELSAALEELKSAEESLKEINEELERRVEERTLELKESEEELKQTLEQAVELNELLKEREIFLSSIIDQSPVPTWVSDNDGTMIRVNDACVKLFDVEENKTYGIGKYNIFKDENLVDKELEKNIRKVYSEGNMLSFSTWYDVKKITNLGLKSGNRKFIVTTIFPVKNRLGQVTNAVFQNQDYTDQKLAVEKIKESAERTRLVMESIPQMAFTATPNGTVNYYNQRWYDYTGQTNGIESKTVWSKVIHEDDIVYFRDSWSEALRSTKVFEHESRIKRQKDHMFRWHLIRAIPVRDANHKIIFWVGTCTDIHDHRLAEEELILKNLELIKINTDLDNFIYTASHDLKAPISNLEGLLMLLKVEMAKSLEGTSQNLVVMMESSIAKFKSTISGLIEITKAQKNLEEGDEIVSIPEIIQDVKLYISNMIQESGAEITVDLQVKVLKYAKVNFNSIVYNLLSNAIKYRSPERKLQILVRTYTQDENTVLEVDDNGLGIRSSQQAKLFTMFKRLHSHVEGTGIGLYIVKRIVENNGGEIIVTSEEGKGTLFKIIFKKMK